MDQSSKQQLLDKSKELLAHSRYLSAEEIFTIESALNAAEIPDGELQEIHDALADYKAEQDAAYADFKTEIAEAMKTYIEATAGKNSTPNSDPS